MTAYRDNDLLLTADKRIYRFLWIGQSGPRLLSFSSVQAFSGYICEVRRLCGAAAVEFRTPTLCIGVLS